MSTMTMMHLRSSVAAAAAAKRTIIFNYELTAARHNCVLPTYIYVAAIFVHLFTHGLRV